MAMNRRFVNLLVNQLSGGRRPIFNLHRIDLQATLFCPTGPPADPAPAAVQKGPAPALLPPAAVSFYPRRNGWMEFMAFNDDVIAVDHDGRTLLYDGEAGAVRSMNPMAGARCGSISVPLGDDFFFVMSLELGWARQVHHCQALSFKDWQWHPFAPLPFSDLDLIEHPTYNKYKLGLEQLDPFELAAYTVTGGQQPEVWVSTLGTGTYAFKSNNGTWSEIGDWALPFRGRAHYVAEHGLWFGFSGKDGHLCAADLRQQPPAPPLGKFPLLHLWEEEEDEPSWKPTATSILPMGSGKLCIARCFRTTDGVPSDYEHEKARSFAVLAGVEVVEDAGTGSLQIIKHSSVCYSVGENMVKPL